MFAGWDRQRLNFYWNSWKLSEGKAILCQVTVDRPETGRVRRAVFRVLEWAHRHNALKYERLYNNLTRFLEEMKNGDA